jgi:hypothetical protein
LERGSKRLVVNNYFCRKKGILHKRPHPPDRDSMSNTSGEGSFGSTRFSKYTIVLIILGGGFKPVNVER